MQISSASRFVVNGQVKAGYLINCTFGGNMNTFRSHLCR